MHRQHSGPQKSLEPNGSNDLAIALSPCGYRDGAGPLRHRDSPTESDTMRMNGPTSGTRNIDEGLDRLRHDLRAPADPYASRQDSEIVNYAALEFELER